MQRAPTDRADVCIVGAGPAGALVADELASDGYDVTVLEAGRRFDFNERQGQMEQSIRPGEPGDVWEMGGERDDYSNTGARTYPLNAEVPAGLYEDFRAVAEARERSISGEIRQIMREHVEQHRLRSRQS